MKVEFAQLSKPDSGTVVLLVGEGRVLGKIGTNLNKDLIGQIARAMAAADFTGLPGETVCILASSHFDCILLVGIGKSETVDRSAIEAAGSAMYDALPVRPGSVVVIVEDLPKWGYKSDFAVDFAFGALLKSYRFDKYRSRGKPSDRLAKMVIATNAPAVSRNAFARVKALADGVFFSRDLTTEPANILYPKSFAKIVQDRLVPLGVEVEILGEDKLKRLGMGALVGVGQGSAHDTQLVVMNYRGAGRNKPVAFVGKGVTFDSGGLSLKSPVGMEQMKWDMSGASAVAGTILTLAKRRAKVNAVGVMALVENMPDGNAQRPGDVVTSLSGQTIEVINTDAEGRLALADALWYTAARYKPSAMIDLATLTGAVIIALGHRYGGLYANDEDLAGRLLAAGRDTGDLLWRLPLDDAYGKEIESHIADVKNRAEGSGPNEGGSAVAAAFLKQFVKDVAWAHLDIAGMAWSKNDNPTAPKGASGFGVRLLDRFVASAYES